LNIYQSVPSLQTVKMSSYALFFFIFGCFLISRSQGANILAIFSCPSPSHLIIEMSMAKVLAENGHNVTVVTTLKPHVAHKNIKVILIALTEEEEQDIILETNLLLTKICTYN